MQGRLRWLVGLLHVSGISVALQAAAAAKLLSCSVRRAAAHDASVPVTAVQVQLGVVRSMVATHIHCKLSPRTASAC